MPTPSLPYRDLSVQDFAQRLGQPGLPLQLIDVREPEETAIVHLPNFVNLPLSQFAAWGEGIHQQLEADQETVVMCHHGMRSAQMCLWLSQQGFTQLHNLTGGIDAYARFVDPTLRRY